ncbi:hypothetical protein NQZ68_020819 [Dissostichus eleginoides]|nr:hypothetical protein NQZ68_020819 [Dissostichus eleginoides]
MLCTGALCPTYRSTCSFSSEAGTATDYALRETGPHCNCGLAMSVRPSRNLYRLTLSLELTGLDPVLIASLMLWSLKFSCNVH